MLIIYENSHSINNASRRKIQKKSFSFDIWEIFPMQTLIKRIITLFSIKNQVYYSFFEGQKKKSYQIMIKTASCDGILILFFAKQVGFLFGDDNSLKEQILLTMKAVPYSPFNRTYKYMCLQNQLAHNKNKKQVRGLVDSNLSIDKKDIIDLSETRRSNGKITANTSFFSYASSCDRTMGGLKKEPLVIHKNSKVNKYKNEQIQWENKRMNRKLSETKCRVFPRSSTEKSFKDHLVYSTIAMKYEKSHPKQMVFFNKPSQMSTMVLSDPVAHVNFCRTDSGRRKKLSRHKARC